MTIQKEKDKLQAQIGALEDKLNVLNGELAQRDDTISQAKSNNDKLRADLNVRDQAFVWSHYILFKPNSIAFRIISSCVWGNMWMKFFNLQIV